MTLKKMVLSATAAAALALSLGGAASAGSVGLGTSPIPGPQYFYITTGDPMTGPTVTADFGDSFTSTGAFTDTFTFGSYFDALGSGSISTTFVPKSSSITITGVTVYGGEGSPVTFTAAEAETPGYIDVPVVAYTNDYITITGTTNATTYNGATYDGTAVLSAVSSAPEPAAWLLMIGGLGLTGLALRRRQTAVQFA